MSPLRMSPFRPIKASFDPLKSAHLNGKQMTVTREIAASSSFVATAAKIPACDHARADRFNGCMQHFPASPKNRSLVRASVGVNTLTGLGLDASAADGTRSASRFAYHESLRLGIVGLESRSTASDCSRDTSVSVSMGIKLAIGLWTSCPR